jgi:DNA polymerase-4
VRIRPNKRSYIASLPSAASTIGPRPPRARGAWASTPAPTSSRSAGGTDGRFGSSGEWYWRICRGSTSGRCAAAAGQVGQRRATFDTDYRAPQTSPELDRVAGLAWERIAARQRAADGHLKVKFSDFRLISRARSFADPVGNRLPSPPPGTTC